MNDNPRDPNNRPSLDELEGALRRAVEAVRAESPPADAVSRAAERACRFSAPVNGHLRLLNRRLLAVGGLAAAVLIGTLVWLGLRGGNMPFARNPSEPELVIAQTFRRDLAAQAKLEDGASNTLTVEENLEAHTVRAEPAAKPAAPTGPTPAARYLNHSGFGAQPSVPVPAPAAGGAATQAGIGGQGPGRNQMPMQQQMQQMYRSGNMSGPAAPAEAQQRFMYRQEQPGGMPAGAAGPQGGLGVQGGVGVGGMMGGYGGGFGGAGKGAGRAAGREGRPGQLNAPLPLDEKAANPSRRKAHEDRMSERDEKPESAAARSVNRPAFREVEAGAKLKLQTENESLKLGKDLGGERKKKADVPDEAKDKDKAPQVWKRAQQRPTFARVYIGNGNSLELVSLQVSVTVEGPRARTVVDHVFRNPHNRVLEGTFEYPLPSGASASYFAMFPGLTRETAPPRFRPRTARALGALPVEALARLTPDEIVRNVSREDWGTPHEARVVGKAKALETYEEIVRGRIDPALLEYAAGNTFSGRVFPIPARGYSRVLIAYEELLPYTSDGVQYRFPLPDCPLSELQFTLDARDAECRNARFVPEGDTSKASGAPSARRAGRLTYTRRWTKQGPGGDVVFAFTAPRPELQVISGRQGESGPLYFYARARPELPAATEQPFAEHAVFLLDTSLSEHPDRFNVSMKLLRQILESDAAIKRFNILTFDVNGRWVNPKGWIDNTKAGRAQALARLDGIVLEGATDLAAALDKLVRNDGNSFALPDKAPVDVFLLSDGQITWGETDVATLVSRFEGRCRFPVRFHCYRTGLGADNLELFAALTRRGGGIFNCFSDAEIPAAALAHRSRCFQVERVSLVGGPPTSDLLIAGRQAAVYPGGEIIIAGRADKPGRVQLVLEGLFQGKRHAVEYVLDIDGGGELAPRGWAEIAVASLLSLNDPKLDDLVTAYCQQFGIASRVASFLVLENANDYKRLNLEAERGKTVPGGDLGRFLDQTWTNLGKVVGGKEAFERFLDKVGGRVQLLNGANGVNVKKLLGVLGEDDFTLSESDGGVGRPSVERFGGVRRPAPSAAPAPSAELLYEKDLPPAYLAARQRDRRDVSAYLREARRRVDAKDVGGAVRVLSSVIEEYPARADALRLVGYRLLALDQPGQAVRLFQQVQQQRPFEPHSYRDLARSLEECGKYGWAAVQYEIVLAGTWHNRFRDSLKSVAQEEYVRMMRQAIQKQAVNRKLADQFGERLEQLAAVRTQRDLRVTITWNTDATDVDLWVIEPDGTKCFYQHNRTKNGGELSQDQTQGYGPERFQVARALPGAYTVIVHYYRANPNLLAGESHVNVVVTTHADTPKEESRRYNVILKKADEQVEVCKVRVE